MRSTSSSFEATRIPRSRVRETLLKNDSTKFNHEPCFGVNTNSNRLGKVARKARVSLEVCAEWLSRTSRSLVVGG